MIQVFWAFLGGVLFTLGAYSAYTISKLKQRTSELENNIMAMSNSFQACFDGLTDVVNQHSDSINQCTAILNKHQEAINYLTQDNE